VHNGYTVTVDSVKVKDPEFIYEELKEHTDLDKETFLEHIKNERRRIVIADKVEKEQFDEILEKNLIGVFFEKRKWRVYPWGDFASHTLGFVGHNDDVNTFDGRAGLERYYENELQGKSKADNVNAFAHVLLNIGDKEEDSRLYPMDIFTHTDPWVQKVLEKEIAFIQEEHNSKKTAGLIIDPNDGRVIGMASTPSFDPNKYSEYENLEVFRNPFTQEIYEMGSIMKPLTIAGALESKKIKESFTYNDKGSVSIDGYTIYNFDKKSRGNNVPLQTILSNSLNTGIAAIVKDMGNRQMEEHIKALKFHEETGIDLPNEIRGKTGNLFTDGRDVEYVTAGYGHGISVTPIAMARALSTLANGGTLPTPRVVKHTRKNGKVSKKGTNTTGEVQRVFSKEVSDKVTKMLVKTVDESLLGGTVAKENYSIAAKTGTASLVNPETKKYYDDKYLHSFFGYFPASDPQFLVFMFTIEPEGVRYASESMTKPFMRIVDNLISYYDIQPDR